MWGPHCGRYLVLISGHFSFTCTLEMSADKNRKTNDDLTRAIFIFHGLDTEISKSVNAIGKYLMRWKRCLHVVIDRFRPFQWIVIVTFDRIRVATQLRRRISTVSFTKIRTYAFKLKLTGYAFCNYAELAFSNQFFNRKNVTDGMSRSE